MYQKIIFFFFLLNVALTKANTVSGTVLDSKNQPLSNALVYIDGTTFGTNTDSKGYFVLNYDYIVDAVLVVSEFYHETVYISNLESAVQLKMNPKRKSDLWETKLNPFTREDAMNVFREQFLGITDGAKGTKILNEDVIKFAYDKKQNALVAFANERIKMKNEFLGYDINFELIEFYTIFSKKSMKREAVATSHFAGTAFFTSIQDDDEEKNYDRHRERVYYGTAKHFFRNFIQGKWGEDEFILMEAGARVVPSESFEIDRSDDFFKIKIKHKESRARGSEISKNSFKSYNAMFRNKKQSGLIFRTDEFKIDMFGNHSNAADIEITGAMQRSLFGNFLPLDYILN
ncbi:MAG: carboxypeptidase-like regulatory domain-containing protein [Flavobacterium sp.]